MSPGEASLASELASVKKSLIKTPLNALGTSDALKDGIRLTTQKTLAAHHLDQLALLLVLLKQLRQAIPVTQGDERRALFEITRDALGPTLLPGGIVAELLIVNLEHSHKANQFRSMECIQAAARLAVVVSPVLPEALNLEPLFLLACSSGLVNRPNLHMISNLLEVIPSTAIPDALLPTILEGLKLPDNGSTRASIIIGILEKRRSDLSDRDINDVVLPLLTSALSTNITNNLNRYLLPSLFAAFPASLPSLLASLSGINSETTFSSWVSIASLGVSLGILNIDQLPEHDLSDALSHEDAAVRLKAYDLITGCKDVSQLLTARVMALVKEVLVLNTALPGSGARSDFASATLVFFTNLRQAGTFARRRLRKPNADTSPLSADAKGLDVLQAFHTWFLNDLIIPALVSARRIPVYRPLFGLQLLEVYVNIFGEEGTIKETVYTEQMVKLLIGCQASEFTEVRGRARTILRSAPTPLPGYPTISSPNAQSLLNSAYQSFSNPRRTQNDAAVAGLCILFEKVLIPSDAAGGRDSISFVDGLIDRLEVELVRGEEGIKHGLDDLALHGLISAARALLGCVDLSSSSAQVAWKAPMHRLSTIITRVWQLTRTIMSLSTSATEEGVAEDGPAHEIAKAHQLLSSAQDEEDDGEVDTRKILSACWRATKEASDLLSIIISQPIIQGGDTQAVWTRDEVHHAGQQYLQWMHEIRHRGTFSKVALAFASLVDAVKTSASLRDLADQWLELELEAITDVNLSTTRRSAALPYSLLSIVAGDQTLLDKAINRLIDLARLDNQVTADITRVHCFNILKIVLLDARQTRLFNNYFERTVMTAVAAFSSANWNVRNVGLILFSTLVHRSLTPSRGGPDAHHSRTTLAGRQTFAAWHAKNPSLLPYIIQTLGGHVGSGGHSPLFPMLIIIRSLRWSEKGKDIQEGLKDVVRPHLASPERQVREVAAQALSSLVSPTEALSEAINWPMVDSGNYNAIHGQLLYVRNLIANVIDWATISAEFRNEIESLLRTKHTSYLDVTCPPIRTELFLCLHAYLANTTPSSEFVDWAVDAAQETINAARSLLPGNDAMLTSAADLLLAHRPTASDVLTLLAHPAEMGRLAALERLPGLHQCLTAEVFERVAALAADKKSGEAVQVAALEMLAGTMADVQWPAGVSESVSTQKRSALRDSLVGLLSAKCIPLREAALPAVSWSAIWSLDGKSGNAGDEVLERLAREILDASLETQSQPRRETAIKSLVHMTSALFPHVASTSLNSNILLLLHQSLLRLLQDDDEDVRLIAGSIVQEGLALPRPVTQSRAVDAWWTWLGRFVEGVEAKTPWIRWMEELAISRSDLAEYLLVLQPAHVDNRAFTSADLFAEEKPNLFRDPLDDARRAAILLHDLRRTASVLSESEAGSQLVEKVRGCVAAQADEVSPIDEAWGVAGILPEYLRVLETAFS